MSSRAPFDVVLFDLGGVLMEFTGIPVISRWMPGSPTTEDVWRHWLESPSVRRFETGGSTPDDFAAAMVDEFQLSVGPDEFLAAFTRWPTGFSTGALELVATLRRSYRVACLSNSNAMHWDRFVAECDFVSHFDAAFGSHHIGAVKPDRAVYDHVVERLGCAPERILFLDDNQICVDGAREAGLVAFRARGLEHTTELLRAQGVLVDSAS